jgi:UDP-N-acetylmuramate dehydrogenase
MIEFDYNLQPLTTFKVPAIAAAFGRFNSLDALKEIIEDQSVSRFSKNILVLGGGSNMLFTKRFDGLIVKNELKMMTTIM